MRKHHWLLLASLAISSTFIPLSSFAEGAGGPPPPVVAADTAKLQSWQSDLDAIGTLSANQGVVIKPEIAGRVTAMYFHSGDIVKTGAPLVQINPDILKAQLASAQAQAILSKANYERALILFNKHVFAQQDLDTTLAKYRSDQATVANNQAQLNQTLIRAPFAGRLGLRQVNLGDYVSPGQTIITSLQALDPLRVDFSVPEVYLSQLATGQTVLIVSRSYPNETFKAKIYAFDSSIDTSTRTLGVRAMLPNNPPKLLPGAFVEVHVIVGRAEKFVTIPQTALGFAKDGQYVYRVIDGKAVKTPVVTGDRRDDVIAILKGLKAGDMVITAGVQKAQDGSPVTIGK